MNSGLTTLLRGAGDVVFPPVCVHCRALIEASPYRHLCAACARRIDLVHAPHCSTCGHLNRILGVQAAFR